MHHKTLSKLVAEYSELINSDIEEAKSQMLANELSEADITEVIEAVTNPSKEKPSKEKETPKGKTDDSGEGFKTFEKRIKMKGSDLFAVEKNVRITQRQADILNRQKDNTLIEYVEA